MLRIIGIALIWVVAWSSTVGAVILDRADIPAGYATALAFDLSNEKALRAELIALPGDLPRLSFLELPFAVKNTSINEQHVVFLSSRPRATFVSYNVRPTLSSSLDLASFESIFNTDTSINALVKSSGIQTRDNNLYFVQDGLHRLFMLRLPPPDKLRLEGKSSGEIEVASPDLVAVRLPPGYIGRTFHETGRMHDPMPIKNEPVIIFSSRTANPSFQLFRVLYDLPEPDWIKTVSSIGIKILGMLIPPLLLVFTNRE